MNLIKSVILFFVYLFIDNTLFNKDTIYNNKIYYIKSNIYNNISQNLLPLTNNSYHIENNNIIKYSQCVYTYKIKKEINIKYLFIYIYNKLLIFLGNNLIIFLFIKNQEIKNKKIILNQITKRVNYDTNFDECSICYTNYKFYSRIRKIIKCPHIYHEDCIKKWIIEYSNKTCPLCRCNVFA